jgi:hypothetical protein
MREVRSYAPNQTGELDKMRTRWLLRDASLPGMEQLQSSLLVVLTSMGKQIKAMWTLPSSFFTNMIFVSVVLPPRVESGQTRSG